MNNLSHNSFTKKICLIFAWVFVNCFSSPAQTRKEWGYPEKYDSSSFAGKSSVLDKDGYAISYGVARALDYKNKYDSPVFSIPLTIRADKDTKAISPFNFIPSDRLGSIAYLDGANAVKLATHFHKDSLNDYRYSVIENDSVVRDWDAKFNNVDFITPKGADYPDHAYVSFVISAIQNKKIVVKMYKLAKPYEVTTLILYNKPLNIPKTFAVTLIEGRTKNPQVLRNGEVLKGGNKLTGILVSMQKSDLDFAQRLVLKFSKDGKEYSNVIDREWSYSDGERQLVVAASEFKEPGNYEILLKTNVKPFKNFKQFPAISVVKFTVPSPPIVFSVLTISLIGLTLVCIAGLVIFIIRRAGKKQQLVLKLSAETARNELNNVRSQLNPHFVFNALSGIQNLMNHNLIEQANSYLSKFANLTRQILDERELISIEDEMRLIKDYLSMEQLRFPFSVEWNVDMPEGFRYTEIPTMLLQPFVENAVKHGVASLKEDGKIILDFRVDNQDIVMIVRDNGNGFETTAVQKGLGLKLSEKRIALLNKNYSSCPIDLNIDSLKGATVRITLKNWLT